MKKSIFLLLASFVFSAMLVAAPRKKAITVPSALRNKTIREIDVRYHKYFAGSEEKALIDSVRKLINRYGLKTSKKLQTLKLRRCIAAFRRQYSDWDIVHELFPTLTRQVNVHFVLIPKIQEIEIDIRGDKNLSGHIEGRLKQYQIVKGQAFDTIRLNSLINDVKGRKEADSFVFINADYRAVLENRKLKLTVIAWQNQLSRYDGYPISRIAIVNLTSNDNQVIDVRSVVLDKKAADRVKEIAYLNLADKGRLKAAPLKTDRVLIEDLERRYNIYPGYNYASANATRLLKGLYQLGYFKSAQLDLEIETLSESQRKKTEKTYGLIVKIIVQEKLKLDRVLFTGNSKIGDYELRDQVELEAGSFLDDVRVAKAKKAIVSFYKDKGFYFASVNDEIVIDPDTRQIELKFHVNEGKEIRIRNITIKGCVHLKEDQIRTIMKTKIAQWFDDGFFRTSAFEEDMEAIEKYYKENGFFKIKVDRNPKKEISWENPQKKENIVMDIVITLNEGEKYYFGGYTFNGNRLLNDDEIKQVLTHEKNRLFNYTQYRNDLAGLYDLYGQKGYIFVKVKINEKTEKNPVTNKNFIFCDFEIDEGKLGIIERISLKGLKKTKNYVVRRQITLKENHPFNTDKLRRSQQKVFNLGYFKAPPKIEPVPGTKENHIDLNFILDEQQTGNFNVGIGWASLSGFFTFLQVSENNFFGNGQRVYGRVEYGSLKQHYQIGFVEPWMFYGKGPIDPQTGEVEPFSIADRGNFFYKATSFSTDLFFKKQVIDPYGVDYRYTLQEIGLALGLGREILIPDLVYSIRFSTQIYQYYDVIGIGLPEEAAEKAGRGNFLKNSILNALTYDVRDNIYNPTEGWRGMAAVEFVGWGGFDQWTKFTFEFSVWFPVIKPWKWAIGLKSSYAWIEASLWGDTIIQLNDYMYCGGIKTVRGWPEYSFFGNIDLSVFNLEFHVPIFYPFLYWISFFDAARGWREGEGIRLHPHSYLYGFGTGVNVRIPVFPQPIKFYLGKGFSWNEKEQDYEFNAWSDEPFGFTIHFDIGGAF